MLIARTLGRHAASLLGAAVLTTAIAAAPVAAQPNAPEWIQRSNGNAQLLLQLFAKQSPEFAGRMGVPGLEEDILDLKPGSIERSIEETEKALAELKTRLEAEEDPRVRQDLEILIDRADQGLEGTRLSLELQMPYFSITSTVYQGLKALLDDRVPAEARKAALVRLRKYAGDEKGHEPIAKLAEDRVRERMHPDLLPPVKASVEKDLANSETFVKGIAELFEKYEVKGYKKSYNRLKKQLAAYDDFVRAEILPNARTDFRQPAALYQFSLRQFGNTMPVEEMSSRAQVAFKEIQNQMQAVALLVAKERGWDLDDYRDVIAELKKTQIVGEAILPHYEARLAQMEKIIEREKIVTLPERKAQIKLADAAESAAVPAPHMSPPRLIGNTGEQGVFMLPLRVPGADGKLTGFDDFTHEAASWTLTAHEARPGHEMQFASMVENGVSLSRGLFSMNSVNVEGWALYAEAEMYPYEPIDAQLIALQHRLMRAARAFLDPGLQLGTITRDEAMRILREDIVLSEAMATQEVERYTFRAPGQAPSYFVGYNRLLEMRAIAERMLGPRFNRMAFNDFILAQGLLPIDLLHKSIVEEFVPRQLAAN